MYITEILINRYLIILYTFWKEKAKVYSNNCNKKHGNQGFIFWVHVSRFWWDEYMPLWTREKQEIAIKTK